MKRKLLYLAWATLIILSITGSYFYVFGGKIKDDYNWKEYNIQNNKEREEYIDYLNETVIERTAQERIRQLEFEKAVQEEMEQIRKEDKTNKEESKKSEIKS